MIADPTLGLLRGPFKENNSQNYNFVAVDSDFLYWHFKDISECGSTGVAQRHEKSESDREG